MPPNPNMAADDASLIAFQSKLLITVKKWKNRRSNSIKREKSIVNMSNMFLLLFFKKMHAAIKSIY